MLRRVACAAMKTRILSATSLFFSCALLSTGVAGQIVSTGKEAKQIEQGCPPALQLIAKFNSSYVFESDFERGHDAKGDALSNQAEVDYRIPIGGRTRLREARGAEPAIDAQWLLRLGARYERFDFDHGGGLPLPNVLQSVAAVIAIELFVDCDESRVDADPLVMIETRPGLYGGQNLDTDDFNAPTIAYFPIKWIASRSFIPVLGVAYDGFRKNQFFRSSRSAGRSTITSRFKPIPSSRASFTRQTKTSNSGLAANTRATHFAPTRGVAKNIATSTRQ